MSRGPITRPVQPFLPALPSSARFIYFFGSFPSSTSPPSNPTPIRITATAATAATAAGPGACIPRGRGDGRRVARLQVRAEPGVRPGRLRAPPPHAASVPRRGTRKAKVARRRIAERRARGRARAALPAARPGAWSRWAAGPPPPPAARRPASQRRARAGPLAVAPVPREPDTPPCRAPGPLLVHG